MWFQNGIVQEGPTTFTLKGIQNKN